MTRPFRSVAALAVATTAGVVLVALAVRRRGTQLRQLRAAASAADCVSELLASRQRPQNDDSLNEELRIASRESKELDLDSHIADALPSIASLKLTLLPRPSQLSFEAHLAKVAAYRASHPSPEHSTTWFVALNMAAQFKRQSARVKQANIILSQVSASGA